MPRGLGSHTRRGRHIDSSKVKGFRHTCSQQSRSKGFETSNVGIAGGRIEHSINKFVFFIANSQRPAFLRGRRRRRPLHTRRADTHHYTHTHTPVTPLRIHQHTHRHTPLHTHHSIHTTTHTPCRTPLHTHHYTYTATLGRLARSARGGLYGWESGVIIGVSRMQLFE